MELKQETVVWCKTKEQDKVGVTARKSRTDTLGQHGKAVQGVRPGNETIERYMALEQDLSGRAM